MNLNTLRSHGSLLTDKECILSPPYDINLSIDKNGLDFDLAKSVREYFHLNDSRMDDIINEVLLAVGDWKK